MYDIDKIKEEVRAINIIRYLGIPYRRSGKNIFILCPEHEQRTGRADRHIGNCVIKDSFYKAYFCYGCGASGDCFKLISLLEGLDMKKDFVKILDIAAESCGGASIYQIDEKKESGKKSENKQKKSLVDILPKEQLEVIGLNPSCFPTIFTECFSENQVEEDGNFFKDVDFSRIDSLGFPSVNYLYQKGLNYSISQMANEDPEAYAWLIKNKASEAMARYKRLALYDWKKAILPVTKDRQTTDYKANELKDYFKAKFIEAESVWMGFASGSEIENMNDSWIFGFEAIKTKKLGSAL